VVILDRQEAYPVYCTMGRRSAGDIEAWIAARLPLVTIDEIS